MHARESRSLIFIEMLHVIIDELGHIDFTAHDFDDLIVSIF